VNRPLKLFAPLALVLFIGACAGTAEVRSVATLAIACDSYATVLEELAPLRATGKLSEGDIAKVNAANELVDPICAANSEVDPSEYVGTVKAVTAQLKAIAGVN